MLRPDGLVAMLVWGPQAGLFAYPTEEIALRGLMSIGPAVNVAHDAGEQAVARAILDGIAPYRRPDGSYCFKNTSRFAIGRKQ